MKKRTAVIFGAVGACLLLATTGVLVWYFVFFKKQAGGGGTGPTTITINNGASVFNGTSLNLSFRDTNSSHMLFYELSGVGSAISGNGHTQMPFNVPFAATQVTNSASGDMTITIPLSYIFTVTPQDINFVVKPSQPAGGAWSAPAYLKNITLPAN
jgi:hypothetical protein